MSHAAFTVNGCRLFGDLSGAVFWPKQRTLVVADLHFEKGTGYAARGYHLPPYDSRETLSQLAETVQRWQPTRIICLGDSFHDPSAGGRLSAKDADAIAALTAAHEWIWIAGNHDPSPPRNLGGRIVGDVTIGALVFRHEADPTRGAGEVSGHYHPKAAVSVRNKRLSSRCFVTDGRRLILPAFGAFTGGLDVMDPAIAGLFAHGFTVHLLGRQKVFSFPKSRLSPWRQSLQSSAASAR